MGFTDSVGCRLLLSLLNRPGWSAAELHTKLCLTEHVSIQAVYKELRLLESMQIVVRSGGVFSLSLAWLISAREQLVKTYDKYLSQELRQQLLPLKGEKKNWHFTDLMSFDRLIVQLVLAALQAAKVKHLYQWLPYPWFVLCSYDLTETYAEALVASGSEGWAVIALDTPIAKRFIQLMSGASFHMCYRPFVKESSDQAFQSSIPPFLVTSRYDRRTIAEFHKVFLEPSMDAATAYLYRKVFPQKARLTVEIEHNAQKAERHAEIIRRAFRRNKT